MTFNSNAIEGNPDTARETSIVLAGYYVVGGKALRDVFDILGHQRAFEEEVLQLADSKSALTMEQILALHQKVLLDSKEGGIFRSGRELAMIPFDGYRKEPRIYTHSFLLSHVIAFLSTFAPLVMETVGWRVFL